MFKCCGTCTCGNKCGGDCCGDKNANMNASGNVNKPYKKEIMDKITIDDSQII